MYKNSCTHLKSISDIPLFFALNSKAKIKCADCDCLGPNLWICLSPNCLRIGCSENYNDHNTHHNLMHPLHSVHMNLSTKRIWCYQCEAEVFPESTEMFKNNQEIEKYFEKLEDPDCSNPNRVYSSNCEQGNIFAFDNNNVGLNVSMSGDTSDSSDVDDNSSTESDKPFGLVGLQNIGNTCYMNAALQALSNTLPLTSFFLECSAAVFLLSEGRKPGLSRTYQALIKDMWITKRYGYVTPSGILYGIRNVHAMFRGYHQHDTQEFLRNFMDQLHEELKQVCPPGLVNDVDNYNVTVDESAMNSSFESSEGEYETCDSGVSERSSLSDETERPTSITKRITKSTSPVRRLRSHVQNDSQSSGSFSSSSKQQVKYRSIISDIFDGKLLSSVQCLTCSRISSRVETFQDLSLPIPSRDHLAVLHERNSDAGAAARSEAALPIQDGWLSWIITWLRSWFYGPTVSLHDCLAAFFSTDELKGDNMYSCERCNKLRNGIKFSKVLQLPEILCVHLKRFRHELMFSSKISSFVSFPLRNLDVRPYLHTDCVSNVTTFDLFSVICHHGTAGGGHYTCYSLNGNQWYEFDDQYVTKVTPETVQACEAYVLFYRKNTATAQTIKTKASEIAENYRNTPPEEAIYVSKQWLNRFKTCAEPGPIDNSDFLCHHGLMHPDRTSALQQLAVVLPKQVYEYLYKKFGGCPPVTNMHVCTTCTILQKRQLQEMEGFLKINRDILNHRLSPTHLMSTGWFNQWQNFVQKRTYDPPGPIDNTRTSVTDYVEVNKEIWTFFFNIYGGGPETLMYPNKINLATENEPDLNSDSEDAASFKRQDNLQNSTKNYVHASMDYRTTNGTEVPVGKSETAMDQNETTESNCVNDLHSLTLSSGSNTSLTDDETAHIDLNVEHKRPSTTIKQRLHHRTRRRRFRRSKIGYKSKQQIGNKYIRHKEIS